MKLRASTLFSGTAHAAILAYAIWGLGSVKPFEVGATEALPIEIMSPQEFEAVTKGSKTSKTVDTPKVKAEKVAEADPEPVDDDTPVAKEDVKAPPPPKAEAPPPPAEAAAKVEEATAKAAAAEAAKAEAEQAAKAEKAASEKAAKAEAVKAEAKAEAAKAEAAKDAREKAEQLAVAAEGERRAAVEKAAKAEADKIAKAEADKAAKEKAEAEKLAKLEADKAVKEKAEKIAKVEAEKAAKAEVDKIAKAEKAAADKAAAEKAAKAAERKFDPSKIAALLPDKPSKSADDSAMLDKREAGRKAAAAREAATETTAGTNRGVASKLSMSQRAGIDDSVRAQLMQCWSPPIGAGDGSLAVRVKFTLNADGTLSDGPTVVNSSSNPAFRAAAGAAMRAVQRCTPLKLPAEAFDYWGRGGISINFDPKDMMGG